MTSAIFIQRKSEFKDKFDFTNAQLNKFLFLASKEMWHEKPVEIFFDSKLLDPFIEKGFAQKTQKGLYCLTKEGMNEANKMFHGEEIK